MIAPPGPPPASTSHTTLTGMLAHAAGERGERIAFVFADEAHTYGALWSASGRFAAGLRRCGVGPGDRVVVVLPNAPGFFVAFHGTLRAGAVAVPLGVGSGPGRIHDLAGRCRARAIVVTPEARPGVERAGGAAPVLTVDEGSAPVGEGLTDPPRARPGDLAYIQYTSGSTGEPKGVELTHANVAANLGQLVAAFDLRADDVFVSWLPVHHDMGLVLMTLVPFALGARLVLLPSSLRHLRAWLAAIGRHRGTVTAAPDFAWRLALRAALGLRRYDLSALRVAVNAAEPVRGATVTGFARLCGRQGVMTPAYGLAEATAGVAAWPPGRPAKVDARGLVSVGKPMPAIELEILAAGCSAPRGQVGEIVVTSPAGTRSYHADPDASASLLAAGGALRTGDLGYLDGEGDLFIAGRLKNVIKQGGRNLAPQEIEETVEALPFVRACAAVGVDRGDLAGEQLYVLAETRGRRPGEEVGQQRVVAIVRALRERLGLRPGRVYLLAPRSIPRTANGKVRHDALRERYLDGRLRRQGRLLFPDY